MKTILQIAVALGLLTETAGAFSLLGPYDDWMQPTNGFPRTTDIGGPMNLGEEYRWNVPVLTYTFDQSFFDYFGTEGAAAVEQAIQILNNLPPGSYLNPTNYPPESSQWNFQAQALNLMDLKSKTLSTLLEQLGLVQPSQHAYCVYDFAFSGGSPVATIIQRNFDPLGFFPTNRVNDSAYNYVLQVVTNGQSISATADEILVNPFDTFRPAVADGEVQAGKYFTGLTRDDVGGLRYLLHTNNLNVEILLTGVHGVGPNAGTYANQAVRRGVDKITFVRRDYDGILGQFFAPYTNQFTDYYLSNSIVVGQQLERVVTEPDILFSAEDLGGATPQITRTGTSNWWNSATFLGAGGPGIIRAPIKLTFSKPADVIVTSDLWPVGSVSGSQVVWGSFDGSTNTPVAYPSGGSSGSNLTLNLKLLRSNSEVGSASWQIPLSPAESIVVQTSTNLVNWVPHLIFGAGRNVEWIHHISHNHRYFRVMPNN